MTVVFPLKRIILRKERKYLLERHITKANIPLLFFSLLVFIWECASGSEYEDNRQYCNDVLSSH